MFKFEDIVRVKENVDDLFAGKIGVVLDISDGKVFVSFKFEEWMRWYDEDDLKLIHRNAKE